jgi:hypothetical protein
MIKVFITTFLLFTVNLIFGQATHDLDAKNGFKHFKLGVSPSQIKNIIPQEKQFSQNPNVKAYEYIGKDIQFVSNVKVERITLHFFKGKLFIITIEFGKMKTRTDFTYLDYNTILSWLEQAYGKSWVTPSNEDGTIVNGAIWQGKKVVLELIRRDESKNYLNPIDYGYISGYISIYDKVLNKQMFSDEF